MDSFLFPVKGNNVFSSRIVHQLGVLTSFHHPISRHDTSGLTALSSRRNNKKLHLDKPFMGIGKVSVIGEW